MIFRKPLYKVPNPIKQGKQGHYIRRKEQDKDGIYHVTYGWCPECFCQTYVSDRWHGERVCPVCGLVLDSNTYQGQNEHNTLYGGYNAMNSLTSDERLYKNYKGLHIPDFATGKETRKAKYWRIISHYAIELNVYEVDKQNISKFIQKEQVQQLGLAMNKIILSLMKYIISTRKHQENRIDRGIFKEENLSKKEYQRVIQFLFKHDDGRYGIVRERDRDNRYYDWVNT